MAGAEQNIFLTAGALKERGHHISILYQQRSGRDESSWESIFDHAIAVPMSGKWTVTREAQLLETLGIIKPDLFYIHKMPDLSLLRKILKIGRPVVRMVHDHDIYCMRGYRYHPLTRKICHRKTGLPCYFTCGAFIVRTRKRLFPLAFRSLSHKKDEIMLNQQVDKVFVVTNYMKEEFITQGFTPNKIEIFPPIPKTISNPPMPMFSQPTVLYIGQIIRGKGVDCLIKALALLKVPYQALIIGTGSHKTYCERLTKKLGIGDHVQFLGWVNHDQLASYYRDAILVAVPSVWPEPIATIGLEVMRYKLPVVGFNSGGIGDWLIDNVNGFLVNWMDIKAFSIAMETLLQDTELARSMGIKSFEIIQKLYDFESYIARMEDCFYTLVRSKQIDI